MMARRRRSSSSEDLASVQDTLALPMRSQAQAHWDPAPTTQLQCCTLTLSGLSHSQSASQHVKRVGRVARRLTTV